MAGREPEGELDARFSSRGASATSWPQARDQLANSQVFWLTTVRPDGRPHVTPLLAVGATGPLLHDGPHAFGKGEQFSQTRWRFSGEGSAGLRHTSGIERP